ncbi:MAG: UDP-glucuronic acid decarboxylase family protein [Ilumatobacteraceae bacterium]
MSSSERSFGAVLVAGGAGFIGSHLVDRLISLGRTVVVVDDLSTGRPENLADCEGVERFRFVECDVARADFAERLAAASGGERFSAVLHLASPASPPAYLARPIETLDTGSAGTRNLLEVALRDRARFLLASTSEVYGDPLEHPQREEYWGNVNPIGPRSCYDEAKRFAEALTSAYSRVHGLEIRIARIFNTYGPRMREDDGRVVTNFVRQALDGAALTVYGEGTQTRSFCYVDDQVDGLLALLDGDEPGPVNLGNPYEVTVDELARLVIELTGSASTVETLPLPDDDPRLRRPDISLATQRLGWAPSVGLRAGLSRTIDDFRRAWRPTGSPGGPAAS